MNSTASPTSCPPRRSACFSPNAISTAISILCVHEALQQWQNSTITPAWMVSYLPLPAPSGNMTSIPSAFASYYTGSPSSGADALPAPPVLIGFQDGEKLFAKSSDSITWRYVVLGPPICPTGHHTGAQVEVFFWLERDTPTGAAPTGRLPVITNFR